MATKTKTKQLRTTKQSKTIGREIAEIKNMTFRDLKIHVIIRGMPFDTVVNSNVHELSRFYMQNLYEDIDRGLLEKFDDWQEAQIADPNLRVSGLRLSHVQEAEDSQTPNKAKRISNLKPKHKIKATKKRERTDQGVFKGTKKALTFKLAAKGRSLQYTINKVMKVFPDARDKSIKIWWKKAQK